MGHHHDHGTGGHDHHHHIPDNFNKAFFVSIVLNLGFTIIEAVYAILANSMSLLADAGHNLGDVLGLVFAWIASLLLHKSANAIYSYGYKKATIIASLVNALILFGTCGILGYESIVKLFSPDTVRAVDIIIVAAIGVVINGTTAFMFIRGAKDDLNIKGAYLHLLFDALVSVGVVVVGTAMLIGVNVFPEYKEYWYRLDPVAGVIITIIIIIGTWSLLRDSFKLILDGVPSNIDLPKVKNYLSSINGVIEVHDLHVWGLSTKENAMTCHLVIENDDINSKKHHEIEHYLKENFNIEHITIQVEKESAYCHSAC